MIPKICVDLGNNKIKIGLVGEVSPMIISPNSIDYSFQDFFNNLDNKEVNKNNFISSIYDDNCLINEGNLYSLIKEFLNYYKLPLNENTIIFHENFLELNENRNIITKLIFEKLGIDKLFFYKRPCLSVYSAGKSSSNFIYSGHIKSYFCIIEEGWINDKIFFHYNLGGKNYNNYLYNLAYKNDNNDELKKYDIYKKINDYKLNDFDSKTYYLPDNKKIRKSLLTKPYDFFYNEKSADNLYNLRDNLFQFYSPNIENIMICGGNFNFDELYYKFSTDIKDRFKKLELFEFNDKTIKDNSSFIGGSIMGSLDIFDTFCATRQEYMENGINIINKKCP